MSLLEPLPGGRHEVVVVGALNADLWVRLPRLPLPGETLRAQQLIRQSGGKGGNQAVGLARLGRSTAMVGCVGGDEYGRMVATQLAHEHVGTEHVTVVGAPTGLAVVMAEVGGESTIVIAPGANGRLTPELVDRAGLDISTARAVLVQLEIPLDAVARAVSWAQGLVVLNAAPVAELPPGLLRDVDVLVVNSIELAQLCGIAALPEDLDDLSGAAADIIDRTAVVVTLGARGAAVLSRDGAELVPGVSVEVADTTAGGDSFCAALVDGLLGGHELIASVRYATRVAALTVQREGAMLSLPTREQVAVTGALGELDAAREHPTTDGQVSVQ